MPEFVFDARLYIPGMSFTMVEEQIRKATPLLLPVATLAPYGQAPLEAEFVCCCALADAVAASKDLLIAPPLMYGYAEPFRAFGGCAGVKEATFEKMIAEAVRHYLLQGIQQVVVLNGACFGEQAIERGLRRASRGRDSVIASVISWQFLPELRRMTASRISGSQMIRDEYLVRALYAFHKGAMAPKESDKGLGNTDALHSWCKRGRDPEKLRAIAPSGRMYEDASTPEIDSPRELFDAAAGAIAKRVHALFDTGKEQ